MNDGFSSYAAGVRRRLGDPACLMCGDDSDKAIEAIDRYNAQVEGVHLCWKCCDFAATAYVRSHGGPPPDAFAPRDTSVYQKVKISRTLAKRVFERDAYRCVTCGDHRDLTCDHIHPEVLGGATDFANLQTMCRSCNSRKGARLP